MNSGPSTAVPTADVSAPVSGDERRHAALVQLSVPFLGFVVPLVLWLMVRHRPGWLRRVTVETLNFSLVYVLTQLVAAASLVALIGVLLIPLVGLAAFILCAQAAVAARRGEIFLYPVNLHLIK